MKTYTLMAMWFVIGWMWNDAIRSYIERGNR